MNLKHSAVQVSYKAFSYFKNMGDHYCTRTIPRSTNLVKSVETDC